jgi:hypothetical protein
MATVAALALVLLAACGGSSEAEREHAGVDPTETYVADAELETAVAALREAADGHRRGMEGAELVERMYGDGPPSWNLVTLDLGTFLLRKFAQAQFDREWLPVLREGIRETGTGTLVFEPAGLPARVRVTFQYRDHDYIGTFTALYVVSVSLACFDSVDRGDPWPSDEEGCLAGAD